MSEDGFHVHGPHDHEVEHAIEGEHGGGHGGAHGGGMVNQIAVITAVLATVGALFSYMGGATQADAGLYKNNEAIKKTEASDQWNFYQSKSSKQAMAELARDLSTEDKKVAYQVKMDRYAKEMNDITAKAKGLEEEAVQWGEKSEAQMHQHHRWAQATTVIQISIALAAIALLTRKKWLEWGVFGVAALGLAIGSLAALHI